ncbi:MAG: hypothetical protein CM1200mP30_04920 [Pseudomonadota bacterium]|nr:MAG: hypothetical protein CM1200mP30_04920 [Pseudomonadota bacterium]
MKKDGLIYWFFIICYAVQFQFSGDWMCLETTHLLFTDAFFWRCDFNLRKLIMIFIWENFYNCYGFVWMYSYIKERTHY